MLRRISRTVFSGMLSCGPDFLSAPIIRGHDEQKTLPQAIRVAERNFFAGRQFSRKQPVSPPPPPVALHPGKSLTPPLPGRLFCTAGHDLAAPRLSWALFLAVHRCPQGRRGIERHAFLGGNRVKLPCSWVTTWACSFVPHCEATETRELDITIAHYCLDEFLNYGVRKTLGPKA